MKIKQTSGSYLNWEEYQKVITRKEHLHFIDSTAKQSLRNLISKEVK